MNEKMGKRGRVFRNGVENRGILNMSRAVLSVLFHYYSIHLFIRSCVRACKGEGKRKGEKGAVDA